MAVIVVVVAVVVVVVVVIIIIIIIIIIIKPVQIVYNAKSVLPIPVRGTICH